MGMNQKILIQWSLVGLIGLVLAKKTARDEELPPGWQKKVTAGSIFPPDLWRFTSPIDFSQIPGFRQPKSGEDY